MNYQEMKNRIETMGNENYEDFIKAVVSFEKGIDNKDMLDEIYKEFMDSDTVNLLNEEFDYMIENLKEQGMVKETGGVENEQNDLVNIMGNVVGNVEVVDRESKNGEPFKVVNFSVVSKDDEGNKTYANCSAYEEKGDMPKGFKQGDFVKLFGQVRISIDDTGKEHSNVRILSSKLLKAKEQTKESKEKKKSVLGAIKKHQKEDKGKSKTNKMTSKGKEI